MIVDFGAMLRAESTVRVRGLFTLVDVLCRPASQSLPLANLATDRRDVKLCLNLVTKNQN